MNDKGVRCGNHGKDRVYHRDASEVKDCYAGRFDDDGAAAAEMAYERHLEDAGYWEARAQEDYERRMGVVDFSDAYWDSQIQAREREEEEQRERVKARRERALNEACGGMAPPPSRSARLTQDGMYRDPESGQIWKVQYPRNFHGEASRLYASLLVVDVEPVVGDDGTLVEKGKRHWVFESGRVRQLRPEWRMTVEEAKEFGALYGTCVYGHLLTKDESIRKGIGPVCEEKYGMPS